jgi:hypothetical protein
MKNMIEYEVNQPWPHGSTCHTGAQRRVRHQPPSQIVSTWTGEHCTWHVAKLVAS